MAIETTDTVIVGGGQAGIAMSEHLGKLGIPHIVLERARIAERWRTSRWDSLVANGPAWHDRFPNMEFAETDGDGFAPKEQVADYFVDYAEMIGAPIRCGVEVTRVRRLDGRRGFRIETTDGVYEAQNVVAATGPFQKPVIPPVIPQDAGVLQMHSNDYRNPDQLPDGAVLVVGGGSSGTQIADELLRSGRRVYLSLGPHSRPPRAYRGLDFVWWLGVLGKWDMATLAPGTEHVTIAVSGAHGGETVDFRRLAERGMTLLGMTRSFGDGVLHFAPDLAQNIGAGDRDYLSLLDEADAYVERYGLDLPEEPEARRFPPSPDCMTNPILELDLAKAGIRTVIWATGFALDYGWLQVDAFDEKGQPAHRRGVSPEPGVYFLGLPWLSRRGSSFIWGVWHDARFLADHIAIQHSYRDHLADARIAASTPAPRPKAIVDAVHGRWPSRPHEKRMKMAHQRLRKFNTKDTYPEQNLDNDLAQVVITRGGRTLYMRGQCPQNLDDATNIDSHDPVEQTHKVMQNIRQLIEEAGGRMEHLVKVVVYITDVRHREAVYRTMGEYTKGVHPVSTGLVVQALARPDWLVEIDATAVIPDEDGVS